MLLAPTQGLPLCHYTGKQHSVLAGKIRFERESGCSGEEAATQARVAS
jgi:hypothetical protein